MADGAHPGRPAGTHTQAVRVLRLWAELLEWRDIHELAERLGVHARTVRRDLAALARVVELERVGAEWRRADRQTLADAVAGATAAERARCAEVLAAMLREVEPAAMRAPSGHAGGEASALRRAIAAVGVQP